MTCLQFYNNMAAPNNCVGGSETSCPATDPAPPPPPASWYANGENHVSMVDGQQLRGAEFYNNAGAPGNCVGGSEQGCSPPGMPEPRGAGSSGLHFAACGCGAEEPPLVGCTPFELTDGPRCMAEFYNCDYNSGCANGSTMSIADGQSLGKGPEVRGHRGVVLVVGMAGIARAADGFAMLLVCALRCLAWIMLIGSRLLPV